MPKITTNYDVRTAFGHYFCTELNSESSTNSTFTGTPADSIDDGEWDHPVRIRVKGPHDIIERTRVLPVRGKLHSSKVAPAKNGRAPDAHLEEAFEMAVSGE